MDLIGYENPGQSNKIDGCDVLSIGSVGSELTKMEVFWTGTKGVAAIDFTLTAGSVSTAGVHSFGQADYGTYTSGRNHDHWSDVIEFNNEAKLLGFFA